MNRIILKYLITLSIVFGSTPFEYTMSFASGYDNNVMRFSDQDFSDAVRNPNILGGATTFDSYIFKYGLKGEKSVLKVKKKEVVLKGNIFFSDYRNNKEKKYWSGGGDFIFKWGGYKNIKYQIRHLNSFYLRHYINRDVSNDLYDPCYFTDRNQNISISQRYLKNSWSILTIGYLQRYYDRPFTEFDLDIIFARAKHNYKLRNIGTFGIQYEYGKAKSSSGELPLKPSSFDRSYMTSEVYLPLIIKKKIPMIDELGFSYRNENRQYDAEDFNDPLHSGRSHKDFKYDFWIKKYLSDELKLNFKFRYRKRDTFSSYKWVSDLKSFNQIQTWITVEWKIDYDNY